MKTTFNAKQVARMILDAVTGSGPVCNEEPLALPGSELVPQHDEQPARAPALASNEEALELPVANFDAVSHVSGPSATEQAQAAQAASLNAGSTQRPANYAGCGPVPSDFEAPLEMPMMNFAKPAVESYAMPHTGKPALPVGEEAPMALPVFR